MLQHVNHRVPVTSVAYFPSNLLLAAYGNFLAVIVEDTRQIKCHFKIFEDHAIHGINVDRGEQLAVVWGGPWIAAVRIDIGPQCEQIHLDILNCSRSIDWIFDIALSQGSHDRTLLAGVTAHNALLVFSLKDFCEQGASYLSTIVPVFPGTNCILYSAHALWVDESHCLIASGTAFGSIIVWSYSLRGSASGSLGISRIHYNYWAHEGSVFDVQISHPRKVFVLERDRRILASCSDDRTVRIWDITEFESRQSSLERESDETGFASHTIREDDAPPCLAKQLGHISRIWHVRIFPYTDSLTVVSFGEDAHSITWSMVKTAGSTDISVVQPFTLKQVAVQHAHAGKHIWSVEAISGLATLTGGADGAIAIQDSRQHEPHPVLEVDQNMLLPEDIDTNFKAYAFLSEKTIVASTEKGHIVRFTLEEGESVTAEILSENLPGLRGYSIALSYDSCVFIAGHDGKVYAVSERSKDVTLLTQTDGKVAGLFAATVKGDTSVLRHVLVTTIGRSTAQLLLIQENEDDLVWTVSASWNVTLPIGKHVTSFTSFSAEGVLKLALGFRHGNIALYDLTDSDERSELVPSTGSLRAHGKDAVTSLLWHDNHVYSTGRDGTYAIHRHFADVCDDTQLRTIHHGTLPFGPNIEGICRTEDEHVWLWGFKSRHFVVFDATAQCEVMSVECGGGHRNWGFRPNGQGGTFIWTKASKSFLYRQDRRPYILINSGGHGREIKSTAMLHSEHQLIATGAEDTDIRIHTFNSQGGFRCHGTIRKHNTGIQHLQWYVARGDSNDNGDDEIIFLLSSGGFEEFYIWRITPDVPDVGVGYVCECTHPRSGKSELRIMKFEATRSRNNAGLQISMVYSDSTLKNWYYHESEWRLLATADYLTACMTQIMSFGDSTLVTASTDGHLAFWKVPISESSSAKAWQHRWQVHQNAILSATSLRLADGSTLIVTGGDDNAIALTRLNDSSGVEDMTRPRGRTMVISRPHAAAVTGLALLQMEDSRLWLFSASIDQRLIGWELDADLTQGGVAGFSIEQRINVPTVVADVSGLTLCVLEDGSRGLLVCGVGMDVWRVDKSQALELDGKR